MSFSVRVVPLLLIALLSVAIPLRAQTPAKAAPKVPRGTVSGRVTIKEKPAPGVVVGLRKLASGMVSSEPLQKATTDQDGVYRITNVAPGSYDVLPSAPAYVLVDMNNYRGKNVIVGEDENVDNINFSLLRGGVITGKVTDADGRPLIQQEVSLFRVEASVQQPQRPQIIVAGNTPTDDRGIYRFFGLSAGRYKVASGRADENYGGSASASRVAFKQVFHPDVSDFEKATIIEVREGSEATDVDIKLGRALQTFTATGRIVNGEDGTPVANTRFGLQRNAGQRFEMVQNLSYTNTQGEFIIDGLAPGRYGLFLYPDPSRVLRADNPQFEVIDQDVSGIVIRLVKGSTISGVIIFEHDDKKAWAKLLELKLRGHVSTLTGGAAFAQTGAMASIGADGSFTLPGLSPGMVNLFLSSASGATALQGFQISRVEHNGVVAANGIEIKDGDQLTGVRVYVSYGTGIVRGVVNFDAGLLPEGARMFARLVKPGTQPTGNNSTFVDARGHFVIERVPAGVYEVMVTVFVPGSRLRPPSAKQQVTVQDGNVSQVSLTLELTPPNP